MYSGITYFFLLRRLALDFACVRVVCDAKTEKVAFLKQVTFLFGTKRQRRLKNRNYKEVG